MSPAGAAALSILNAAVGANICPALGSGLFSRLIKLDWLKFEDLIGEDAVGFVVRGENVGGVELRKYGTDVSEFLLVGFRELDVAVGSPHDAQ